MAQRALLGAGFPERLLLGGGACSWGRGFSREAVARGWILLLGGVACAGGAFKGGRCWGVWLWHRGRCWGRGFSGVLLGGGAFQGGRC